MPITDRNIVCLASQWGYDPTSKHHVMRLLARHNHVVWVNYHASRRPRLSRADAGAVVAKLRSAVQGPRRVAENVTVVTPLVIPLPGNRTARALNARLLTRQIRSVLRTLPDQPVQLWSYAPDADYLLGRFDEECAVYYCVDAFAEFSGYDRAAILAAEERLARQADLVVTTSRALFEAQRGRNPNTILVTHGVDHAHFARAMDSATTVPADIAALPRPVLGFWGLIQDWVDVELIAAVARARPHWSIVLIGESAADVSSLRMCPNVRLLGRRPYEQLPSYARGFDVALIPFKLNVLTNAVNPIKLREYLSAGLPVVSTPLPEAMDTSQWVAFGEDGPSFLAACERALANNSDPIAQARREAMRSETWEARLVEIESALNAVQPASSSPSGAFQARRKTPPR